jgi:hypothetical protein
MFRGALVWENGRGRLCLRHFATHEQSSKAGLMSLQFFLVQQGATRHFHPVVLETLLSHGTRQLNLASLRPKELPFRGLSGGRNESWRPPDSWALPWYCEYRTRTYYSKESRIHPHET